MTKDYVVDFSKLRKGSTKTNVFSKLYDLLRYEFVERDQIAGKPRSTFALKRRA